MTFIALLQNCEFDPKKKLFESVGYFSKYKNFMVLKEKNMKGQSAKGKNILGSK